jgi:hypothetical protein
MSRHNSASPEDDEWLSRLIERSPLLPDAALRRHWRVVLPWLRIEDRYALAGLLLEAEQACGT